MYVNTPIITTSDCEGAGEMFRVTTFDPATAPRVTEEQAAASMGELTAGEVDWSQDFFGKPASLTVSGQLNAENFAMAFGDVYTFGPTFRAENSNTTRHAAEFWMIEPEIAFADLEDDMNLAEDMLKYVIRDVQARCADELTMLNKFVDKGLIERLEHVASSDFARVTYTEAIEILEQAVAAGQKFDYPVSWGIDLQTEHERFLTEQHFKRPTFVTDYPAEIKAFYMRLNDDGKTVAAADCLVPGIGEIIGGSQREERLDVLERRIAELGMDASQYKYYLDLRRYGTCPHAGFGLGFERLVMYLTGVGNIRDVIPHPRPVGNANFNPSRPKRPSQAPNLILQAPPHDPRAMRGCFLVNRWHLERAPLLLRQGARKGLPLLSRALAYTFQDDLAHRGESPALLYGCRTSMLREPGSVVATILVSPHFARFWQGSQPC